MCFLKMPLAFVYMCYVFHDQSYNVVIFIVLLQMIMPYEFGAVIMCGILPSGVLTWSAMLNPENPVYPTSVFCGEYAGTAIFLCFYLHNIIACELMGQLHHVVPK
jgi:hypothetical protein